MAGDEEKFREAAANCLALARTTCDSATRIGLLTLAQKWLDLATSRYGRAAFLALIQDVEDQIEEP